ncbi:MULTISPECIES: hypothetical protein [Prevotella]|uniref:hypothetical protein n=1 Tax=Prevotella TaxID=838 RepID=UPI0010317A5D|nr:hypothetical protein [Prevotella brunnea]MDR0186338.1 hypothetical protein [Prevotella brunnea]
MTKRVYEIPCTQEIGMNEREMILAGSGPGGEDITPPDTGGDSSGTTTAKYFTPDDYDLWNED